METLTDRLGLVNMIHHLMMGKYLLSSTIGCLSTLAEQLFSAIPSEYLRKLEIEMNDAFNQYREMYFEGGVRYLEENYI